jgi:tetratricopeptide (TPR) repeat protein
MRETTALLIVSIGLFAMVAQAAPPVATQGAAASSRASLAAEALSRGDAVAALARADEAVIQDPRNAWAHYNRAAALAELRKVDEAVKAYDLAAERFGDGDRWGKSVAIWGKAHLLYRAGRCPDAAAVFAQYARTVEAVDPPSAALARSRSASCHGANAVLPVEVAAEPKTR